MGTKKKMSTTIFTEEITKELQEKNKSNKLGWKQKDGSLIAFSDMKDLHLGKVSASIENREKQYKENLRTAEGELYNVDKHINNLQSQIDRLNQQVKIHNKEKEIATNSLATNELLKAQCEQELINRGKTQEELLNTEYQL